MKRSSLLSACIGAAFALMLTAAPIDYHAGGAFAAEIGNLPTPTPKPDAIIDRSAFAYSTEHAVVRAADRLTVVKRRDRMRHAAADGFDTSGKAMSYRYIKVWFPDRRSRLDGT